MLNVYKFLKQSIKIKRDDFEKILKDPEEGLEVEVSLPKQCRKPKDKLYFSSFVGKKDGEEITRGKIMSRGKRSDSLVVEWHVLTRSNGIFAGFGNYSDGIYKKCQKGYGKE